MNKKYFHVILLIALKVDYIFATKENETMNTSLSEEYEINQIQKTKIKNDFIRDSQIFENEEEVQQCVSQQQDLIEKDTKELEETQSIRLQQIDIETRMKNNFKNNLNTKYKDIIIKEPLNSYVAEKYLMTIDITEYKDMSEIDIDEDEEKLRQICYKYDINSFRMQPRGQQKITNVNNVENRLFAYFLKTGIKQELTKNIYSICDSFKRFNNNVIKYETKIETLLEQLNKRNLLLGNCIDVLQQIKEDNMQNDDQGSQKNSQQSKSNSQEINMLDMENNRIILQLNLTKY